MKTNRLAAAASTAVLALSGLIACSPDQATSPVARIPGPAVFNLAGSSASVGDLIACKTGNAGSFTVVFDAAGATRSFEAGQVNAALTPAGTRTYTFNLAAGACLTLYSRPIVGGVTSDPNVRAVITEAAGPTLLSIVVNDDGSGNEATSSLVGRSATLQFNMFHDAMATFNNAPPPPPSGCTYTKGWYQNPNGAPTVIAVDGRSIVEAQTIFSASPAANQQNGVSWGRNGATDNKPNNLLNLYQQFLAALQNLGGDANEDNGPAAVDAAIDAVQAGTSGTGLYINTNLTNDEISALIDTLSDFNEGTFAGWPHCAD